MTLMSSATDSRTDFDPRTIERPDPALMKYYIISSLVVPPLAPLLILVGWIRYRTLRYRFDDEGVQMSWGLLFRREINLTYRRIQDIHVHSGLIQRWMGLSTINIQTASGSSLPEMRIEGILQADRLRDFLYSRMRGAKSDGDTGNKSAGDVVQPGSTTPGTTSNSSPNATSAALTAATSTATTSDETLDLLEAIRDNLRQLVDRQAGQRDGVSSDNNRDGSPTSEAS